MFDQEMFPNIARYQAAFQSALEAMQKLGVFEELPPRLEHRKNLVRAKLTIFMTAIEEQALQLLPQAEAMNALASEVLKEAQEYHA